MARGSSRVLSAAVCVAAGICTVAAGSMQGACGETWAGCTRCIPLTAACLRRAERGRQSDGTVQLQTVQTCNATQVCACLHAVRCSVVGCARTISGDAWCITLVVDGLTHARNHHVAPCGAGSGPIGPQPLCCRIHQPPQALHGLGRRRGLRDGGGGARHRARRCSLPGGGRAAKPPAKRLLSTIGRPRRSCNRLFVHTNRCCRGTTVAACPPS